MLSPLRNRFGIPGVISVIALVFAMLGGAYAASNNSGGKATASAKAKKGPRGPKGATGPAGSQGPAGPAGVKGDAGANGAAGAVGPAGPAGPEGKQGKEGKEGKTGPTGLSGFTETLPSGKTETGVWVAAKGSTPLMIPISFPIPLAAGAGFEEGEGAVASFVLNASETNSEEGPGFEAGCTGTLVHPTAPAGILCIYTEFETFSPETARRTSFNKDKFQLGYGPTGTVLYIEDLEGEGGMAVGSWAVTAP